MLYIQGKIKGLESLRNKFGAISGVIEKAEASGLNKIGAQAQTAASKSIRAEYTIKAADVKKMMSRVKARAAYSGKASRMFTILVIRGGRFGLHKFGGSPKQPVSQAGIPVKKRKGWPSARLKKSTGRFKVRRDPDTKHAPFVARMASGHVGIFMRRDRLNRAGRQMIRELTAKSVAQMFEAHGRDALTRLLEEKGPAIMRRELEFYLSKIKKS